MYERDAELCVLSQVAAIAICSDIGYLLVRCWNSLGLTHPSGVPGHLTYKFVTLSGEIGDRDRSWMCSYSALGKPWVARACDCRVVQ